MALVPIQRGPAVKREAMDTTAYRPVDTGGVASAIGGGLETAGAALGKAAEVQNRIDQTYDEAGTKTVDNQYLGFSTDIKQKYLATNGIDALNGRKDAEDALRGKVSDLMAQAKTERQRAMLADILPRRLAGDLADIGGHAVTQTLTYARNESAGRQALAETAAGQASANPKEADRNIATVTSEVDAQGKLNGWPAEYTAAKKAEAVSRVRSGIATQLVYSGNDGPTVGKAYVERYGDQLDPKSRLQVEDHIRVRQSSIDAESRRVEAQAQGAIHQAQAENKQNAELGLFQIENGGPTDDKTVAGVMAAARDSGDPLLVERAGKAITISNTKHIYNNATPAQLQDEVNDLSARVANGKGTTTDAAKLDTLKSMYEQSQTALRTDALSWGASHLGVQVQPLNWNDQGSISGRLQTANVIAARTGTPPMFLTSSEAAQLAPTWANGTAEQKVGLIQQLARMGGAGTLAARQVATEPLLAHLVGLAGLPDAGVAAAIVHSTMAGPDVIKAHPQLGDGPAKQGMDQEYQARVGGALRLMPEADAGTRATAANYFAAKMSSQGVFTYGAGAAGFPNAINTALGGYNDHGVMRGGLGTHAGATTVLPVGTSQAEFDAKIARARDTTLQPAGNGVPVWANGNALKVGEVKSSQFVPVGDGRYALYANGAFVQKRGGGRYELDWRAIKQ